MTAQEYSRTAAELRQLAERTRPEQKTAGLITKPGPFDVALNLAVYHLRQAANEFLKVAEGIAQQEKAK